MSLAYSANTLGHEDENRKHMMVFMTTKLIYPAPKDIGAG